MKILLYFINPEQNPALKSHAYELAQVGCNLLTLIYWKSHEEGFRTLSLVLFLCSQNYSLCL